MIEHDPKHKLNLLGADIIDGAPSEYWSIATMLDLGIPIDKWESYSLKRRGKIMAVNVMRNQSRLVEHHVSEMKRRSGEKNSNLVNSLVQNEGTKGQ
jgi:hypothetical protein